MPRKPSKPPQIREREKEEASEEELSEEEMEEVIKESKRELEQEADMRQPPTEEYPEGVEEIRKDIADGWDQLLKPQFKGEEKEYEEHFKSFILSAVPVANIERQNIPRYLSYFDENWQWIKMRGIKIPPYLWASFRMVFELNLTRAIRGMQRKMKRQSRMSGGNIETNIEQGWNKYIEPDFKGTKLENFSKNFSASLSNVIPLANIQEEDIYSRYLPYFDEIWQWMKIIGVNIHPQGWDNFRFILEINLTKSIEGFEMQQQANVQREEEESRSQGVLESFIQNLRGGS